MNLARIRLVTFDVTDTLLQFKCSLGKQYSEIGALHGVYCNQDALAANFKTHWYQLKTEHPNYGKNSIGWQDWWHLIVYRTFKDADLNADDKKLAEVSTNLIELYKSAQCWQQCYGTLGILSYLRNRNISIGIVSNFDERLDILLENTNVRHYFRFVLTSYAAGFEKPDPRIFAEAIKKSNVQDLQPDECLHVGDTAGLDYIGAKNAGWNAALIYKNDMNEIKEKYSNINPKDIYPSLYDLHKYLSESTCSQRG